jgi:hypothetical protein
MIDKTQHRKLKIGQDEAIELSGLARFTNADYFFDIFKRLFVEFLPVITLLNIRNMKCTIMYIIVYQ